MSRQEIVKALTRETGGAILVTLVVILLLVKLGASPVSLLVVPDSSMEPTLRPGDLLIAVKNRPHPGEVGVVCATPFYCMPRRVLDYRSSTAIIRADAGPLPLRPISASAVKYRAIKRIPLYGWLPPLVALLGAAGYLWLYNGRLSPGSLAFRVFTLLITVAMIAALLYPLSVSYMYPYFDTPRAELKRIEVKGLQGKVVYTLEGIELVSASNCSIQELQREAQAAAEWSCNASVAGDTVYFTVPREAWSRAVKEGPEKLLLRLDISLAYSSIKGRYPLALAPRPLKWRLRGRVLTFRNPNPVPVMVNVTVYAADKPGSFNVSTTVLSVPGGGEAHFEAPAARYVYLDVTYMLGGRRYHYRLRVG